jgi:hypothetical protein
MTISVGERPATGSAFGGTTDIAFAPNGHLFITGSYGNARVLEYAPDGKRVKQWGKPDSGPGEFLLPHAIQIDEEGMIFVADWENGRIQKFNLKGKFLGEICRLGRVYSLKLAGKVLWAGVQEFRPFLSVASARPSRAFVSLGRRVEPCRKREQVARVLRENRKGMRGTPIRC